MFEPDEYIFTKLAYYFKRKKKQKQKRLEHIVYLNELKPRLTIIARALTGNAIDIYEAEKEGGYKNNNFFLPSQVSLFNEAELNVSFYLFRVLYLSVQKDLGFNWNDNKEHDVTTSREQAFNVSKDILEVLFKEYPAAQKVYDKLIALQETSANKEEIQHYIHGKWMVNSLDDEKEALQNFSDKVKSKDEDITTT
ncbi:MAG: NorD protein, partial [Winogradskyella sp.]|nr:NorD protein [Winogradskyella sp.]